MLRMVQQLSSWYINPFPQPVPGTTSPRLPSSVLSSNLSYLQTCIMYNSVNCRASLFQLQSWKQVKEYTVKWKPIKFLWNTVFKPNEPRKWNLSFHIGDRNKVIKSVAVASHPGSLLIKANKSNLYIKAHPNLTSFFKKQ